MKPTSQIDPAAVTAWESATVQNLDPVLAADASAQLWEAIVTHRSTGDVAQFAATARRLAASSDLSTRDIVEQAITALTILSAPTPLSTHRPAAESAAKE
jgi:hypothetical protein